VIEPRGCRDTAVKLEALLESYERAQDDIIRLDVLQYCAFFFLIRVMYVMRTRKLTLSSASYL